MSDDEKEKPSEWQGLPLRKSLKNFGNLKEGLTPKDFGRLEKEAREKFAAIEAETKDERPKGRDKVKRNEYQKQYARTARRNRTTEQKRRQVIWTRNWRRKQK